MQTAEQNIQIANRLYEMRRTLKSLNPDYSKKVIPFMAMIRDMAKANGTSEISATVSLMSASDSAAAVLWIGAAFVEMCDPSKD